MGYIIIFLKEVGVDKFYFTYQGLEKINKEVMELQKKLKTLQSQVASAAEVGGNQYHDNSSYEMLVIDIRGIDKRLTDCYFYLNRAIVVEPPNDFNRVRIGTRVKVFWGGKTVFWEIVGFGESNPQLGLLAYNTPLASLMIGKGRNEVVSGLVAGKQTEIEILDISKPKGE